MMKELQAGSFEYWTNIKSYQILHIKRTTPLNRPLFLCMDSGILHSLMDFKPCFKQNAVVYILV